MIEVRTHAIEEQLSAALENSRNVVTTLAAYAVANGADSEVFSHLPAVWNERSFRVVETDTLFRGYEHQGQVTLRSDQVGLYQVLHEGMHRASYLASIRDGRPETREIVATWVNDATTIKKIQDTTVDGLVEWIIEKSTQIAPTVTAPLRTTAEYALHKMIIGILHTRSQIEPVSTDAAFIQSALTGDLPALFCALPEEQLRKELPEIVNVLLL